MSGITTYKVVDFFFFLIWITIVVIFWKQQTEIALLLRKTWRRRGTGHRSESGGWSRGCWTTALFVFVFCRGLLWDCCTYFVWSKFRVDRQNGNREGSKEGKKSAPPRPLGLNMGHPEKVWRTQQVDSGFRPPEAAFRDCFVVALFRESSINDCFYFLCLHW